MTNTQTPTKTGRMIGLAISIIAVVFGFAALFVLVR